MRKKYIDREIFESQFVKCPKCGYRNKKGYALFYGTCNCCGFVLDKKIVFKNEMKKRRIGEWD